MIRVDITNDVLTICEQRVREDIEILAMQGIKDTFHTPHTEKNYDIRLTGLLGETALNLYLGLEWRINPEFGADVAGRFQVRAKRRLAGGLFIREFDKPACYVLALVETNRIVHLAGWINYDDARQPQHHPTWLEPNRYLVAQQFLNPITTLPWKVTA